MIEGMRLSAVDMSCIFHSSTGYYYVMYIVELWAIQWKWGVLPTATYRQIIKLYFVDILNRIYYSRYYVWVLFLNAGQFLFVSGQRAQTLDTPWSVGRQWFEQKGDFSVSDLSMFIRAIFAFKCRILVIFVRNVISRLIWCAYFVIFVIVRRYIFFW